MAYHYQIILDINKDIENWVVWANKISYWMDRKNKIIDQYPDIIEHIHWKTVDEVADYMKIFLEQKYKQEKEYIEKVSISATKKFENSFESACKLIENITKQVLCIENFTVYLTTFPRGPYNKEHWYFLFCIYWNTQNIIWAFLHEVLHFQFIHYFKENHHIKLLTPTQFEMLKEALTVILNEEAKELLFQEDKWYAIHAELREKLLTFRLADKDFDKLVEFWAKEVINYSK